MPKYILLFIFQFLLTRPSLAQQESATANPARVYKISELKVPIKIDGDWNKRQWRSVKPIYINNPINNQPHFIPVVRAKMAYDKNNVYLIYQVQDRYVKSVTTEIGGPVWKDSAVEFFFSPDSSLPANFFNFEINCGGTPLLGYRSIPRTRIDTADIKRIEIGHSLPKTVQSEIEEPVTWTVEFRIPLDMLAKYSNVTRPKKGVVWRANFYKIAEITSNPHYLTWAEISPPGKSFHAPEFFGWIQFK
ncbi:MAG: carbohydrate-binding family 9-like protein [Bacteroidota bacterium]